MTLLPAPHPGCRFDPSALSTTLWGLETTPPVGHQPERHQHDVLPLRLLSHLTGSWTLRDGA